VTVERQYEPSGAPQGHYNSTNTTSIETAVLLYKNKMKEVINHETKQI